MNYEYIGRCRNCGNKERQIFRTKKDGILFERGKYLILELST